MYIKRQHPAGAAGRTSDPGGPSSEHHPLRSPGDENEGLIGAQDAGGAQVGAMSHPLDVIHKFTPKAGQGLPQNKSSHCVGNPRGQKKQKIGQGHVGENRVCRSLLVAKQDWRDVAGEKDGIGQRPNSYLCQICGFQGCLAYGSQGIFVKRHGEDFGVAWSRQETLQETPAVFLRNSQWTRIPTFYFS